jgi:hypothetical protein
VVRPLIRNLRDLYRYTNGVTSSLRSHREHVNWVDILGIEAVRIFRPSLFEAIQQSPELFTNHYAHWPWITETDKTNRKKRLEELIDIESKESPSISGSVIRRLFPAADGLMNDQQGSSDSDRLEHFRDRRVASFEILRAYVEGHPTPDIRADLVASSALLDTSLSGNRFDDLFASLDDDELGRVVA